MALSGALAALMAGSANAAWSPAEPFAVPPAGSYLSGVAVAGDGGMAVVSLTGTPPPPRKLKARKGKNRKQRRTPPRSVFASVRDSGATELGPPQQLGEGQAVDVGMADDGTVIVAWSTSSGVFASIRRPGQSFGSPVRVSGPRAFDFDLDVAPDGHAGMVWTGGKGGGSERCLYRCGKLFAAVLAPGGGFSAARQIGRRVGFPPEIDVAPGGTMVAYWTSRKEMAALRDAGGQFGTARGITGDRGYSDSVAAAAPSGAATLLVNGSQALRDVGRVAMRVSSGAFSSPVVVPPGDGWSFGQVVSDGPNSFLISLNSVRTRRGQTVVVNLSGGVFGQYSQVFPAEVGTFTNLASNNAGDAAITGCDFATDRVVATYRPGGTPYFPPYELISPPGVPTNCEAYTAVDSAGNATAIWSVDDGSYEPGPPSPRMISTNPG